MSKSKKKRIPRTRIIFLGICAGLAIAVCLVLVYAVKAAQPKQAEATPAVEETAQAATVTETTVPNIIPKNIPTPEIQESAAPEDIDFPLREGSEGEAVLLAQARLMELHYLEADEPRPVYSSAMGAAVRAFRRQNNLPEDALLTEVAYNRLMDSTAKAYVLGMGEQGDEVHSLQMRLYELGYLRQAYITGKFDAETEAAIKSFQKKHNLAETGEANKETQQWLYEGDIAVLTFQEGDQDPAVKIAQERLVALQYLPTTFDPTGEMDTETVLALRRAQAVNGLLTDGILGEDIMECLTKEKAEKFVLRLGMSGDDVRLIQERLRELGYIYYAQITGYYGESTQAAVTAFQKGNGQYARGYVSRETWDRLFSGKARAAYNPIQEETPKEIAAAEDHLFGVEKLLQLAQSKVGSTYVRGAKGPNSFDCSGFVHWCLQQAGVRQRYRSSNSWANSTDYAKIEAWEALQPGDILVFSGDGEGSGHVGIYAGDGYMIDASSSMGRVRTKRLADDTYWANHFICAFRIWT